MRTEINYSDRKIHCVKCRKFILKTALDAQCLILENGLILLNCAFWRCPDCLTFGRFISPILRDEKPTLDDTAPDVKQLERRAAMTAKRHRIIEKRPDYGLRKSGDKISVNVGGEYLGSFDYDEAKAVRDVALAKQFGYKAKEKQTDTQPQNHFSAT